MFFGEKMLEEMGGREGGLRPPPGWSSCGHPEAGTFFAAHNRTWSQEDGWYIFKFTLVEPVGDGPQLD